MSVGFLGGDCLVLITLDLSSAIGKTHVFCIPVCVKVQCVGLNMGVRDMSRIEYFIAITAQVF